MDTTPLVPQVIEVNAPSEERLIEAIRLILRWRREDKMRAAQAAAEQEQAEAAPVAA